ncbi:hypothetical protein B7494_g8040 [Chlorociboria aeruginascens]|nr:hypothetical protein B7494_g8040 [Chlorociboria aeruginascens]
MAVPTLPVEQSIKQLDDARKLVLSDASYYPQIIQGILPIIGPTARVELRRWGSEFLAETFASPTVPAAQKETLCLTVLETLKLMIENPQEDNAVVKCVLQAAASIYPLVVRWIINNPWDGATWACMVAIKMRILRIWDSAPPGIRICCIKFAQRVVLVQTAGPDADPKRGDNMEVSLTMVPPNHALLQPRNLEAEASGLLDRMLGTFQEKVSDPQNPLAGRIQQHVERLLRSRTEIFDEATRKRGHQAPTDGLDQAKRQKLGAEFKPSVPKLHVPPLAPGSHTIAELFTITSDEALKTFNVGVLSKDLVVKISISLLQRLDADSIDQAVNGVLARYESMKVPEELNIDTASLSGIDDEDDEYEPDFYPAEDTEQILNKLDNAPPEEPKVKVPDMALGVFTLPPPPPLTPDQATHAGEGTVTRVFGVMQTLEEPGSRKNKFGMNRLAASAYDRDAWITIITRLATRAAAGLEDSSDAVKAESDTSSSLSLSNTIREGLYSYILDDFRKRIDIAVAWLCEEWYNDKLQVKLGEEAVLHYEKWSLKLLDGFTPFLDGKDKVLTRFLSEIPGLSVEVFDRVKALCRDPVKVNLALTSLLYLVMMRPPVRELALDAVEDIWNTYDDAKPMAAKYLTKWRPGFAEGRLKGNEEENKAFGLQGALYFRRKHERFLTMTDLPPILEHHPDPTQSPESTSMVNAPTRTLSPISENTMNSIHNPTYIAASEQHSPPKPRNGIIRPVPSDNNGHLDPPPDPTALRVQSKSDSGVSLPPASRSPLIPPTFPSMPPQPVSRKNSVPLGNSIIRTISSEFGPTKTFSHNSSFLHSPDDSSPSSPNSNAGTPPLGSAAAGSTTWSSAVGRANLGKSGRVIERLMGENDMLKRDLQIERLRAEESAQTVKMAEGKMETMVAEYEGRLHEAAINKTMLRRRERQLADVKAQVEGEKNKAAMAVEREKGWREAMEKMDVETKEKVDEAQTFAALMEGRNKTMVNHWKEQGDEVNKTVGKLGREIETLVIERRGDDERMNILQDLCYQQAEQLKSLQKEKLVIQEAFERYKREQDESLREIKETARRQEETNERALRESQRVLGELKWALGVKRNLWQALGTYMATRPPLGGASQLSKLMSPSSSALSVTSALQTKTFVIASDFVFKPEGVSLVKKKFEELLEINNLDAYHEWDAESQTFIVRCLVGDSLVLKHFHTVLRKLVRDEGGDIDGYGTDSDTDDDSDGERKITSNKIQRFNRWKKDNEALDQSDEKKNSGKAQLKSQNNELYPEGIRYFKHKSIWSCPLHGNALDSLIPEKTRAKVANLSDCMLHTDLNSQQIYIGSHFQEGVHLAICKLDTISKYSQCKPLLTHLFYTEENENIQFVIKTFLDVKRRMLQTTLLDPFQMVTANDHELLPSSCTIRCCLFDQLRAQYIPFASGKLVSATNHEDKDLPSQKWKDFTYSAKGTPADDPRRRHFPEESIEESTPLKIQPKLEVHQDTFVEVKHGIKQWAKAIPLDPAETDRQFVEDSARSAGVSLEKSQTPPRNVKPAWDTYKQFPEASGKRINKKKFEPRPNNSTLAKTVAAFNQPAHSGASPAPVLIVTEDQLQPLESSASLVATELRNPFQIYNGNGTPESSLQPQVNVSTAMPSRRDNAGHTVQNSLQDISKGSPADDLISFNEDCQFPITDDDCLQPVSQPYSEENLISFNENFRPPTTHQPSKEDIEPSNENLWPPAAQQSSEEDIMSFDEPSALIVPNSLGIKNLRIHSNSPWARSIKSRNPEFEDDIDEPSSSSNRAGSNYSHFGDVESVSLSPHFESTRTILDDDDDNKLNFTSLQPIRGASFPSLFQHHYATAGMQASRMYPSAPLQDISISKTNTDEGTSQRMPSEVIQECSEFETRKYYRTMNQKASKPVEKSKPFAGRLELPAPPRPQERPPQPPVEVVDPLPDFLLEINTDFEDMMKTVRGFRGEVLVQVEFGRLVMDKIPSRYVSTVDGYETLEPRTVLNILDPEPGGVRPRFKFTNILTTAPNDIENNLLCSQDGAGNAIWVLDSTGWDVTYEFNCLEEKKLPYTPFIIDINAETFAAKIKTRRNFGQIFVHGTKRQWDYCLSATGIESDESLEELYGDFANAIQMSLYIPPGTKAPELYFELDTERFENLKITHLRVRRTCKYLSFDQKSILNVTEKFHLELDQRPVPGKNIKIYRGVQYGNQGGDKVWHEISITSVPGNAFFEQNKNLESGDEVGWTVKDLTNHDVAASLYKPACIMLKHMDGVGFHNNNHVKELIRERDTAKAFGTNPPSKRLYKGRPKPGDIDYRWW